MDDDLERLQGRWMQVLFTENGMTGTADAHGADGAIMTVSGHALHVALPGQETLIEGSFAIDASHRPKRIDWIDSMGEDVGKLIPAIYELKGYRFNFAAADAGHARPKAFHGGPGITIRAFVRV